MRYLSVCSGIEAATVAWHPLGWTPAAFSEIEAFPRAVLAHHYPNVPLHGDFTTIGADDYGPIELLVGGTPCQSFSIAGLRGGLADDRGNLALEFLKLAQRKQPEWIVYENVPGIISDKTNALQCLLDGLEELGYVVDIDILDAQFFGVPQRRRRVFICGQKASSILNGRTLTSALTITQCLAECLLLTLGVLSDRSKLASESCGFDVTEPVRSLKRRIKLFGLDSAGAAEKLAGNLAVLRRSYEVERSASASASGGANCATSAATRSPKSGMGVEFPNTGSPLSAILADTLATMSECTTSTSTSETTASKIYSCATALLRIAEPITQSMESSPSFWSAVSSSLTALKEFTAYARSASSDLFTDLEWLQPWHDFVGQAVRLHESLGRFGASSFGSVFPIADSLSGHPAPRRETREAVAALTANGVGTCGAGDNQGQAGHLLHCEPEFIAETVGALCADTHPGAYSGQDAYTGRLISFSAKDHGADAMEDCSPTLRAGGHAGSHANAGVMPAIAFDTTQITSAANYSNPKPGDACHPLAAGAHPPAIAFGGQMSTVQTDRELSQTLQRKNPQAVATSSAVRRLTPRECERLQGFPETQNCAIIRVCQTEDEKRGIARSAAWSSAAQNPVPSAPVAVDVQIDLERQVLQILSLGKSSLSVSNAADASWSHLSMPQGDFVRLAALMTQTLARITRDGSAASLQNIKSSSHPLNGSAHVLLCGQEIAALASDAERFTTALDGCTKSITSERGSSSPNYGLSLETLVCCVSAVISGFIPAAMRTACSYELRLTTHQGYTAVPYRGKPAADGPRYKALGNSFAVPVVRWLGQRIQLVDSLPMEALHAA